MDYIEEAKKIYESFESDCGFDEAGIGPPENYQKNCAIICVEHILRSWKENGNLRLDSSIIVYYEKVKSYIENEIN